VIARCCEILVKDRDRDGIVSSNRKAAYHALRDITTSPPVVSDHTASSSGDHDASRIVSVIVRLNSQFLNTR